MPPAFNLSQDQTLQFISCGHRSGLSLLDRVSSLTKVLRRLCFEPFGTTEHPHKLPERIVKELLHRFLPARPTILPTGSQVSSWAGGASPRPRRRQPACPEGGATIQRKIRTSTSSRQALRSLPETYGSAPGKSSCHLDPGEAPLADLVGVGRARGTVQPGILQPFAVDAHGSLADQADRLRRAACQPRIA